MSKHSRPASLMCVARVRRPCDARRKQACRMIRDTRRGSGLLRAPIIMSENPCIFRDFCRHEKAHNICALRGCINEPPHQSTATLYIKNPQKSSNIVAVLCPEKPCTFQSKDDRSALRAFILPQKSETLYSTIIVLNAL